MQFLRTSVKFFEVPDLRNFTWSVWACSFFELASRSWNMLERFFEFKSSVQEIRSRRSLMDQFPELKKEIRQYYNSNKSQRKNIPDRFYRDLFEELSIMVSGTNTPEG